MQQQASQEKTTLNHQHQAQVQALQKALAIIQVSLTWRATAPLRALASIFMPNQTHKHITAALVSQMPQIHLTEPLLSNQFTNFHQVPIENMMHQNTQTHHQTTVTKVSSLNELLAYHDQQFIGSAFLTLLGREPDPEGMGYYLDRLRTGISKVQILMQLRLSSEGKTYAAKVEGLDQAIQQYKNGKYWFIGWLFRIINGSESNHPTQCKIRSIENQIYLLSVGTNNRFNQLESTLSSLHNLITHRMQPDAMPVALQQQANTVSAHVKQSQTSEPEELQNLSSRARDIYFQLKNAVATHTGRVA
jgi:hypothetical protein